MCAPIYRKGSRALCLPLGLLLVQRAMPGVSFTLLRLPTVLAKGIEVHLLSKIDEQGHPQPQLLVSLGVPGNHPCHKSFLCGEVLLGLRGQVLEVHPPKISLCSEQV